MNATATALRHHPMTRYLAPLAVFLLLSALQPLAQGAAMFLLIYAAKTFLTLGLILFLFKGYRHEIAGRFDPWAVGVGLLVLIPWLIRYQSPPEELAGYFDPAEFPAAAAAQLAVAIRLFGSVVTVPVMEELVWRSFLMRYLVKEDFLSVPLGTYRLFSFAATIATFTLMHPLWLWMEAALAAVAYGYYLVRTKNLVGCIIAHAVTNAGLGIYIIATGRWALWM